MNGNSSDRNLLLGIVALQMDFISRDALIEAMHGWTLDKTRSLSEILVQNGALDPADRSVLENLVERHIVRHGGDPGLSLSSLDLVAPASSTLDSLHDPDIEESLAKLVSTQTRVDRTTDPERTGSWQETGEQADGRFRIIHLHDEGGLGCVFLARDGEVNREVALKQMKEDIAADPQLRARFVFEAEITGNLEHPGIVPVYGKGEYADGRPYYAMRFIRGDTLKAAVDRLHADPVLNSDSGARQREFQKLLRRFLVVCETMAYVHSRGIIHRDLKPRNILLGPYGETLVVDWGLAKVIGHKEKIEPSDPTLRPPSGSDVQPTTAGSRVGTPAYMSPEQARGEIDRLGPATDVYSLGATLYYMLTKQPPFTEQDVPEVLHKVERGEFYPPRAVKPGVDRALEGVCLKAMALRPEDRYDSCRALADDLERWLADQPVAAYREPLSKTATRWARRQRQWVVAAALVLIIGVMGLSWHDLRVGREKARAERARDQAAEQLQMTRTALRELLAVAGTRLANVPRAEALRGELAEKVLEYYKKLLESFPNDSNIQYEVARVYRVIALIDRMTGQFSAAETAFQQSIRIFEQLADDRERGTDAREWLVQAAFERGGLYLLQKKPRRAEQEFRDTIRRADSLGRDGNRKTYLRIKGDALCGLSDILYWRGEYREAHATATEAVEVLERAVGYPDPSTMGDRAQWLLSIAFFNRGQSAKETEGTDAAKADFERAIEAAAKIKSGSDYTTSAQLWTGKSLNELGRVIREMPAGRADARTHFDRGIEILNPLAAESNAYPYYREALAQALVGRATAHTDLLAPDARKDCEAGRAILARLLRSERDNPRFLSLNAEGLEFASRISAAQGDLEKARQLLNEAISNLEQALVADRERAADTKSLSRYKELLKGLAEATRP